MKLRFVVCLVAVAACSGGNKKQAAQPAPAPVAESKPAVSNTVVEEPAPPPEPTPPPVIAAADSTGVPECDEYLAMVDQLIQRCPTQLGPALESMQMSLDAQRTAFAEWKNIGPEERRAVAESAGPACRSAVDAIRQSADAMSCPLTASSP